MIQAWPSNSASAEAIIVRKEGDEVVFLNDLKKARNAALNLKMPIDIKSLPCASAARGREGRFEGIDYRGEEVFAVTKNIPSSEWHLIVKIDKDEILDPLHRKARDILATEIALVLIAALAVAFRMKTGET